MLLFSKLNKIVFEYFYPENISIDKVNNFFRGDLTDISAENEALPAAPSKLQKLVPGLPLGAAPGHFAAPHAAPYECGAVVRGDLSDRGRDRTR